MLINYWSLHATSLTQNLHMRAHMSHLRAHGIHINAVHLLNASGHQHTLFQFRYGSFTCPQASATMNVTQDSVGTL